MSKTIVLTGGGTAGHVIPNLALLPLIKTEFSDIHYIGSQDGIESTLLKDYPFVTFHSVSCAKLRRSFSLKNFALPFQVVKGISQAKKLLKEISPDVVFSKGGFVSVPVVLGCPKDIPVICHESDLTMGLANKLTARRADTICTTFETTGKGKPKFVCTGTPIRAELFSGSAAAAKAEYGIGGFKPVMLAVGGSSGSAVLNKAVRDALPTLSKQFDIVHIVGKNNVDESLASPCYVQIPYTNRIADLFAAAAVVVTRGGSNAIHELLALTKPMLIVPLSKAASRGDQIDNAKYFLERGFCRMLPQEDMKADTLAAAVKAAYFDRDVLTEAMQKAAAQSSGNQAVFDVIKQAANAKKTPPAKS